MIKHLLELISYFPARRKRQLLLLILLSFLGGIAEILSVGMVAPFLAALIEPQRLMQSGFEGLDSIAVNFTQQQISLWLTVLFCAVVLFSGVLRVVVLYLNNRFCFRLGHDLVELAYKRTIYQDYAVHTQKNSAQVIHALTISINEVIFYVILPCLTIISAGVIAIAICIVMSVLVPAYALISIAILAAIYVALTFSLRSQLKFNSELIANHQIRLQKLIHESLTGIREIIIDSSHQAFTSLFSTTDRDMRTAQYQNQFMGQSPRFFLEMMGTVVIAMLAFIMVSQQPSGAIATISVLAILAIGLQRLLPAAQSLYQSWALLQGAQAALSQSLELLRQPENGDAFESNSSIEIVKSINLVGVSFKYPQRNANTLVDINLTINSGTSIGIIGKTGVGKSTLIDIILGLQLPTSGAVEIDGIPLTDSDFISWRRKVAHVPQNIFLLDASINENVAFGISTERIDHNKVIEACKLVGLDEFICTLPLQYNCTVGERGVQISGGQRQRLAIARALYKGVSVLILDEATSALDVKTEDEIISTLYSHRPGLTIIVVAHRLATLERCDKVFELIDGRLLLKNSM